MTLLATGKSGEWMVDLDHSDEHPGIFLSIRRPSFSLQDIFFDHLEVIAALGETLRVLPDQTSTAGGNIFGGEIMLQNNEGRFWIKIVNRHSSHGGTELLTASFNAIEGVHLAEAICDAVAST